MLVQTQQNDLWSTLLFWIVNLEWLFDKLIWQIEIGESTGFLLVLIFKIMF
jgi:hypothetical protein